MEQSLSWFCECERDCILLSVGSKLLEERNCPVGRRFPWFERNRNEGPEYEPEEHYGIGGEKGPHDTAVRWNEAIPKAANPPPNKRDLRVRVNGKPYLSNAAM